MTVTSKKALKCTYLVAICILVLSDFTLSNANAEETAFSYTKVKSRFSFAQTYFSLDEYYSPVPLKTQFLSQSGDIVKKEYNRTNITRLTIGGLHFWGHTDFYVSFPIKSFEKEKEELAISFDSGVETGMRLFPFGRDLNSLRPFLGISWNYINYAQNESVRGQGPIYGKSFFPIQSGLTYTSQSYLFDLGIQWWKKHQLDYPIANDQKGQVDLPDRYIWTSIRYAMDTSLSGASMGLPKSKSSWFVGLGPSASFPVGRTPDSTEKAKPVFDTNVTSFHPDMTLGYEYFKWKLNFILSFRPMLYTNEAYGVKQEIRRNSFSLEAFRFLFDYNGFVPFFGVAINREDVTYQEYDGGGTQLQDVSKTSYPFGFVFGWDIRPIERTSFVLRTNLRYVPNVEVPISSTKSYTTSQLEFDFIQMVYYFNY